MKQFAIDIFFGIFFVLCWLGWFKVIDYLYDGAKYMGASENAKYNMWLFFLVAVVIGAVAFAAKD